MTITAENFDAAVKQPWSTETCLIAQAEIAAYGSTSYFSRTIITDTCLLAYKAQIIFDNFFQKPGDEKKPELQALRASLPICCSPYPSTETTKNLL